MMAAVLPAAANAQTFDNDAVIALHRAGLGDGPVIAKIHAMPCRYDTSTAAMVGLKKAGLSDGVIVAMVESCATVRPADDTLPFREGPAVRTVAVPQNPPAAGGMFASTRPAAAPSREPEGIYWSGDQAHGLTLLRPTGQTAVKLVGNGSILFPHMAKLIVPRATAQMAIAAPRPAFRFYFNPQDNRVSEFGGVGGTAAQSPNEFSLVHFRQDGATRQMTIGRVAPYVSVSGIDPKNTLPFGMTDLGDGVFNVDLPGDLPPGEYGFVLIGDSQRSKQSVYRVYDFTITGAGTATAAGAH
jgi:hypothetical protein